MKRLLSVVAGSAVALAMGVASAATISGTVKFDGAAPTLPPLQMSADPICAKQHAKPVTAETLVLGAGQTMGNVIVRVKSGLPAGKKFPAPSPAVIDQRGCLYTPHVVATTVGQPVKFTNSDETLHNIHGTGKANPGFNSAMPKTVKEKTQTFSKPEVVAIKCDVHPWMSGYIGVFDNPFFSVTKSDGKFTITGLDPGTYDIEVWHEKLGTQTAKVTVAASDTKTQDFTFKK